MHASTFTVLIPTYNYGHFLRDAIESVLAQTRPATEIIVVDDGSIDDTKQRLFLYRDRIRYIYQDNQGPSAARNTGIHAATSSWIAFLDADDLWHPRKLEVQAQYLSGHSEVDLLASDCTSTSQGEWSFSGEASGIHGRRIGLDDLVLRSRFGPSGVVVRKRCLESVGLFDPALPASEDRDLWIRIAASFHIVKLDARLWCYRTHANNSSRMAERMEAAELRTLRKSFQTIPSLRGRRQLRWRALSLASYSAAYMYDASGRRFLALWRMLQSLALWPLPHASRDMKKSFERGRALAVLVLRLVRIMPEGPQPKESIACRGAKSLEVAARPSSEG